MTDSNSDIPTEFISIDPRSFPASNESNSSPFDTLWTEFARSHPRLSPPRTPTRGLRHAVSVDSPGILYSQPTIDLRALAYDVEYDSNLMCPICHVPFINPVVLDCDHTFCSDCLEQYRTAGSSTERSRCPTCRSYHLGGFRRASRLIKNMCNDIRVTCPNEGCNSTMARGCIEQHSTKECPDQDMSCPDVTCTHTTKRKSFVPEQCVHKTHIECECGASIRLGRGESIKHKDGECPLTMNSTGDVASPPSDAQQPQTCPGLEFGCEEKTTPETVQSHTQTCFFARLAPHFKKQTAMIDSLSEQLKMAKTRNEVLETGLERLAEIVNTTNRGQFDRTMHGDEESDVEEIERHDLTRTDHQNEMLPGDMMHGYPDLQSTNFMEFDPRITHLELQTGELQSRLSELDARSSMALMNETLRIREELAHLNGAMYSTRSQVQWLLNRERIVTQRDAMAAGGAGMSMRGRPSVQQTTSSGPGQNIGSGTQQASFQQGQSNENGMNAAWSNVNPPTQGGSGPSSAATSPIFGAARPMMRRSSGGGSQERVKL